MRYLRSIEGETKRENKTEKENIKINILGGKLTNNDNCMDALYELRENLTEDLKHESKIKIPKRETKICGNILWNRRWRC